MIHNSSKLTDKRTVRVMGVKSDNLTCTLGNSPIEEDNNCIMVNDVMLTPIDECKGRNKMLGIFSVSSIEYGGKYLTSISQSNSQQATYNGVLLHFTDWTTEVLQWCGQYHGDIEKIPGSLCVPIVSMVPNLAYPALASSSSKLELKRSDVCQIKAYFITLLSTSTALAFKDFNLTYSNQAIYNFLVLQSSSLTKQEKFPCKVCDVYVDKAKMRQHIGKRLKH